MNLIISKSTLNFKVLKAKKLLPEICAMKEENVFIKVL